MHEKMPANSRESRVEARARCSDRLVSFSGRVKQSSASIFVQAFLRASGVLLPPHLDSFTSV